MEQVEKKKLIEATIKILRKKGLIKESTDSLNKNIVNFLKSFNPPIYRSGNGTNVNGSTKNSQGLDIGIEKFDIQRNGNTFSVIFRGGDFWEGAEGVEDDDYPEIDVKTFRALKKYFTEEVEKQPWADYVEESVSTNEKAMLSFQIRIISKKAAKELEQQDAEDELITTYEKYYDLFCRKQPLSSYSNILRGIKEKVKKATIEFYGLGAVINTMPDYRKTIKSDYILKLKFFVQAFAKGTPGASKYPDYEKKFKAFVESEEKITEAIFEAFTEHFSRNFPIELLRYFTIIKNDNDLLDWPGIKVTFTFEGYMQAIKDGVLKNPVKRRKSHQ